MTAKPLRIRAITIAFAREARRGKQHVHAVVSLAEAAPESGQEARAKRGQEVAVRKLVPHPVIRRV